MIELIEGLSKKCGEVNNSIMKEFDLSSSEFQFLSNITTCKNLTGNQVADELNLSVSRVSRIIEKLVQKNYLTRETKANDRRSIKICLTPTGKQIQARINDRKKQCYNELVKALSPKEKDLFKKIAIKLINS